MGCSSRRTQLSKYYRYTIPELRELSTGICSPFDLSRLSFNAVRGTYYPHLYFPINHTLTFALTAGIVPALGERVMAPRESAVQRALGWSQQTTDTSEEVILFHGNRAEYPVRQPINAPPEPHTQKDEGFAHFLKTHSSPNHRRVTAGGRIVPMEKRPAPPRFSFSVAKDNLNTGSAQEIMDSIPQSASNGMNCFEDRNNGMDSPTKIQASGYDTAFQSALMASTVSPGFVTPEIPSLNIQQAALESNIFLQSQLLSYGQGLSSASLYPSVSNMASQLPLLDQQYPHNLPYLPYATPLAPSSMSNSGSPLAWDADPHLIPTLQTMLTHANQAFELYDQQLKDLDKYRATHHRRDELVCQRVGIVARRADVKEEIRRLHVAITLRENAETSIPTMPQSLSPTSFQSHAIRHHNVPCQPLAIKEPSQSSDATPREKPATCSKLNVAAAAYVPRTNILPSIAGASPRTVIAAAGELRMPSLPAPQYSRIETSAPELKVTDAWGERVGAPPDRLLREQSLLAESILSELNSPKVSDDDASDSTSAQSVKFAGGPTSTAASDGPDLDTDQTCRAPASVEADYEKLMDAMRKPKGTTTRVALSDGQLQILQGLDLQQPRAENITDFERSYWARKPAYPDYLTSGNKENSRVPSLTAKTSTLSFENSVLSQDQAKPYRGSLRESVAHNCVSLCLLTI